MLPYTLNPKKPRFIDATPNPKPPKNPRFIDATSQQLFELTSAAESGEASRVEELLQRPQDPNLGSCLETVAYKFRDVYIHIHVYIFAYIHVYVYVYV